MSKDFTKIHVASDYLPYTISKYYNYIVNGATVLAVCQRVIHSAHGALRTGFNPLMSYLMNA